MKKKKNSDIYLKPSDAPAIKSALLDYLSGIKDEEISALINTLENAEPEINTQGVLHIGNWIYDRQKNALINYLPPGEMLGYDFQAFLSKEKETWKVIDFHRVEVFRR